MAIDHLQAASPFENVRLNLEKLSNMREIEHGIVNAAKTRAVAESTPKFLSGRQCLVVKPRYACPPSCRPNHIRHRPSPQLSDKGYRSSPHVISIAPVAAKRFELLVKIKRANRAWPIRHSALTKKTKTTKTKSLMLTLKSH